MKSFCMAVLATSVALGAVVGFSAAASAAGYKIVERIKGPDGGGGWDYLTFDPAMNRIYIGRRDGMTVFDLKTKTMKEIAVASHAHMPLVLAGGKTIMLTESDSDTAKFIDTATDAVIASVPVSKGADGAIYDPVSGLALSLGHASGDVSLIDIPTHKVVGTIPVGGTLEFPATDGRGMVYVNVEDKGEIAAIDVKDRKVVDRYKLSGSCEPTGLAYVPAAEILVSVCDGAAKIVDAPTGKELASLAIGKRPDAAIYDPVRHLVFVPCGGSGELDVISVADRAHLTVVQKLATQTGSRTGMVDPQTGRLYLAAAKFDPAAKRGAPFISGSFELLVVAP